MNSKDEIVKVFDDKGGDAHPPAIFTQTGTVGQMDACGTEWPDANFDTEKMARLALQTNKMFGFATVRVPFCITVDADAFGCKINPGNKSSQPSVAGSRFRGDGDITDVPGDLASPAEFLESRRVKTVLDAAGILAKEEDLFLVAGMNGPMACINNLLGMENVLMTLMMEPDRVDAWLKAVTPHLVGYAGALSEATDCVMVIEEASSELTPPEYFDSVFEPYLPQVIKGAQKGSFCTTHSCGGTMEVADRLASLGQDGISLEVSSDPQAYLDLIGGKTLSLGAINPIETLLSKGPSDVVAEAKRSAELGFDFVTPECGVPPLTPNENLQALARYREL
ncbi:MAG: hypothetical protein IKP53_01050 [Candidatus Methanomethylophilaceae archaeon]|nr:hypothetical protein [Candidatus Methanomethylophilaceae archaeon]MBR7005819.1 hypothetical protein [Candidatus Methanomethylophilaceae archaeon]